MVQLAGALHRDCETVKRLAAVVVGKCLRGAVAAAEECGPDRLAASGPADILSPQNRNYNAIFSGSLLSSLFAVASHACVTGRDSETKDAEADPKCGDFLDGANLLPLSELLMNVFLAVLKAYVVTSHFVVCLGSGCTAHFGMFEMDCARMCVSGTCAY